MTSVNKTILLGRVGQDPQISNMQNGNKVASFTLATSESWKDKVTGEKKESTQWHRVVVFSKGLVDIVEKYLKKGEQVYLEGQLQTRNYDKDGTTVYVTEVVLQNFNSHLILIGGKGDNKEQPQAQVNHDFDDEIPF